MKATEVCLISMCLLASRLVLVHAGVSDPDELRQLTADVRKKCIVETKTTLQAVQDTEYGEFPEDDRLKCYFKCALTKLGMMDKNGKIKFNLLKKVVPDPYKELAYEMIDSCTEVSGSDNCEKAFNFMKCLYHANPMAFIAP